MPPRSISPRITPYGHFLEHFETALFPLGIAVAAAASSSMPLFFLIISLTPLTKAARLFSSILWVRFLQKNQASEALAISIAATGLLSLLTCCTIALPQAFFLPALYLLRILHQGFSSVETPLSESISMDELSEKDQAITGSRLSILTVLSHLSSSLCLTLLVYLEIAHYWPLLYGISGFFSFVLLSKRKSQLMQKKVRDLSKAASPLVFSNKTLKISTIYLFGYFTFFFTTYYFTLMQLVCFPEKLHFALKGNTLFLSLNLLSLVISKKCVEHSQSIRKDPLSTSRKALWVWLFLSTTSSALILLHPLISSAILNSRIMGSFSTCFAGHFIEQSWTILRFALLLFSATILSCLGPQIRLKITQGNVEHTTTCLAHTLASSASSILPFMFLFPKYFQGSCSNSLFGFFTRTNKIYCDGSGAELIVWIYACIFSALLLSLLRANKVSRTS